MSVSENERIFFFNFLFQHAFIKDRSIHIQLVVQKKLIHRPGENDLNFFLFSNKQFSGMKKQKRSQR